MTEAAHNPPAAMAQAHLTDMASYEALYKRSIEDGDAFWGDMARKHLTWQHDFATVQDCDLKEGQLAWFRW